MEEVVAKLPDDAEDRIAVDALLATRDSCGLAPGAATDVMSWAARALIRSALAEAGGSEEPQQ